MKFLLHQFFFWRFFLNWWKNSKNMHCLIFYGQSLHIDVKYGQISTCEKETRLEQYPEYAKNIHIFILSLVINMFFCIKFIKFYFVYIFDLNNRYECNIIEIWEIIFMIQISKFNRRIFAKIQFYLLGQKTEHNIQFHGNQICWRGARHISNFFNKVDKNMIVLDFI